MDSSALVPAALVLGVMGAIAGTLALWGGHLSRRSGAASAGREGVDPAAWRSCQERISRLEAELGALREASSAALRQIDVAYRSLPGQTAPNSALLALRDGAGRTGLLLHVYGLPQVRVLEIRDGALQPPPEGQVLDMENKFVRDLQGPGPARTGRA